MLRAILGVLCLVGVLGFMTTEDAKAAVQKKGAGGKFKSYKDGTLTVMAKDGDKTFKVAEDFKCEVFAADAKPDDKPKETAAKDAFKDLAEGTRIFVVAPDDKVSKVVINPPKKGKQ